MESMISRRLFLSSLATAVATALTIPSILIYIARGPSKPGQARDREIYAVGEGYIDLPAPMLDGDVSVESALANRRSIREYLDEPLTLDELSQILWASYGVSETIYGFKTTPSAGATYPLNIYAVIYPRGVITPEGKALAEGSYIYEPHSHRLRLVRAGDLSSELYRVCVNQEWVLKAKAVLVFTAVYERTTRRYGERGIRYVWIEVGHAGQNVYLQATSLGLATVAIGAFYDDELRKLIGAGDDEHPLYVMPVARPARQYRLRREDLISYIAKHRS
ncbi:nitroreductase [Desulfurococcaceae archaeon AG1]|jgi:SagB-type dehydrogenase family enzyme|nr:nitroreductase [Desulfurococcaceae archaeon AG1]